MKIKVFVIAAMLFAGVSAFAQDAEHCGAKGCHDTRTTLSNGFFDNWFIGAGVGTSVVTDGVFALQPVFGFGLIGDINLGKWIDPSWGIRAGFRGLTANSPHLDDPYRYGLLHADLLWNLSNQIFGYKADRRFSFIPYASVGLYIPQEDTHLRRNYAVGGGILAKVALTKSLDLDIDLNSGVIRQHSIEVGKERGKAAVGSATIGISYKFAKRTFTTKAELIAPYCAAVKQAKAETAAKGEELAAAQEEIAALKAQPKDELANAILDAYSATSTFVADKWDLVNHEKIVLLTAANIIKACPDHKFVVSGYADAKTGYPAYNLKLSEKRAKAVANYLVNELGVNPDQLIIEACGGVGNMYFDEYRLSRCVVIKAQK